MNERIEKAAIDANNYKNYTHLNAINLHLEWKTKDEVVEQCVYDAAIEMSYWILSHQLISVDEELQKDDRCVFAMYKDGNIVVAKYLKNLLLIDGNT